MKDSNAQHSQLKQKILHETRSYLLYVLFIGLLLGSFTFYQRLLLDDFSSGNVPYGYCFIEALILAKIILIGQSLKLGERFLHYPLIFPVLHKTLVFSFFLLIFELLKIFVMGYIDGKNSLQIMQAITQKHINILLAKLMLMFCIFVLFFAFLEISRVMGENKLFSLFFRWKKS